MDPPMPPLKQSKRSTSIAGIQNYVGSYNCFLNVVVQSLWHIQSFRTSFLAWPDHVHTSDEAHCVLCALFVRILLFYWQHVSIKWKNGCHKVFCVFACQLAADLEALCAQILTNQFASLTQFIFQEYQAASKANLSSVDLRKALSTSFSTQSKFQEGIMADATECFIGLIDLISELLPTDELKQQLIASVFDLPLLEFRQCASCGRSSNKTTAHSPTTEIYIAKLVQAAKVNHGMSFEHSIKASLQQDPIQCEACKGISERKSELLQLPKSLSLSLVWPMASPTREMICAFLNLVSMEVDLSSAFYLSPVLQGTAAVGLSNLYRFKGMILYYGRHYIACFYHSSVQRWIKFDDTRVAAVGMEWNEVRDWCVRCRFQPSMLFFEQDKGDGDHYVTTEGDLLPTMVSPSISRTRPEHNLQASLLSSPVLECPHLEGMLRKKSKKKEWVLMFARLSDWKLMFFKEPQVAWNTQIKRYAIIRRDPPDFVIPISAISRIIVDNSKHNFSDKPWFLAISTIGSGQLHPASDFNLFVPSELAFALWVSALSQAITEFPKLANQRLSTVVVDNDLTDDNEPSLTQSQPSISESFALASAPDASPEDLAQISRTEAVSPRHFNESEDSSAVVNYSSPLPSLYNY